MLRLAADENFNGDIVRNLRNRLPQLDLVRIQDTLVAGMVDEIMLEWVAANQERILLTHDLRTIPPIFYSRLNSSSSVPSIFAVPRNSLLNQIASDLELLVECSSDTEWSAQILYLPL